MITCSSPRHRSDHAWVLQEIAEKGFNEVVAIQLELQKNIYQAKIGAVDKLIAHAKAGAAGQRK
jgi:hypothetical protein